MSETGGLWWEPAIQASSDVALGLAGPLSFHNEKQIGMGGQRLEPAL